MLSKRINELCSLMLEMEREGKIQGKRYRKCVSVCVCVCVREREMERERKKERERER